MTPHELGCGCDVCEGFRWFATFLWFLCRPYDQHAAWNVESAAVCHARWLHWPGAGVPSTPVEAEGRAQRRVCPVCGLRYVGNSPTCWAHPLVPKPSPGGQGTPPSEAS